MRPNSIRFQHHAILALLLAMAVVGWIVVVLQQRDYASMDMPMSLPTVGREAPLFLANWVVMMVAMMFPAAAPMALAFYALRAVTRPFENAFAHTWVFVSAYLLVWAIAGLVAYTAFLAVTYAFNRIAVSATFASQLGGATILAAGIYQITPLKEFCLSRCREPIRFVAGSWREGRKGAFRMGLLHGAYCVGCCWLLFVILFPLGMSVISMIIVTMVIVAERRTLNWAQPASHVAGLALVLYGAFVIVTGQLLPMSEPSGMTMPEMPMEMSGSGYAFDGK
jgi:predicted metal-binding membrane protein